MTYCESVRFNPLIISLYLKRNPLDLSGRWRTVAIGRMRPDRMATTGPLNEPAIPVSPQTAGPAVPERESGPGGVSGCSAMPGAWKSQPAPDNARGIRVQDTVERHAGLDVVMEKIDPWGAENPASDGLAMIDDFRLRGSRTWRRRGGPLIDGGGST